MGKMVKMTIKADDGKEYNYDIDTNPNTSGYGIATYPITEEISSDLKLIGRGNIADCVYQALPLCLARHVDKSKPLCICLYQTGDEPMLETEWAFYESNREDLVKKYCGKYVVISGEKVIAVYDSQDAAYWETIKTIPRGSFMIHHIMEEEEVIRLSPFAANV